MINIPNILSLFLLIGFALFIVFEGSRFVALAFTEELSYKAQVKQEMYCIPLHPYYRLSFIPLQKAPDSAIWANKVVLKYETDH